MRTSSRSKSLPDIAALLAGTDVFAGQEEALLYEFADRCDRVYLAPGEFLMQEGEPADCLYVLVSGRLRVQVKQLDGAEATVGEVARNEVVGEMAIIADELRSATVIAIRDSELLMFSREDFEHLVEKHPLAMLKISRQIVIRLRRSIRSQRPSRRELNIAIIPAGKQAPIARFIDELVGGLARIGSTLVLDSDFVDEKVGPGVANAAQHGSNNDRLLSWLNEQEAKHQYVIYRADESATNWTRRCLRLTDRVLAVGLAGSNPARNQVEEEFLKHGSNKIFAQTELVLVHEDDGTLPTGTSSWLSPRDVTGCHHVRTGAKADYERLARLLTGRAFGLVLGGGGARGLAHVGVIRAIQEIGIPIDAIGGTSMGAIIAGLYAMDSDIESITNICRATFRKQRRLLDITFPAVALTAGKRIVKHLETFFGDTQIEDLWLKYYCVSSNLTRAETNVHQDGPCWQGIRASISLPGILPPVFHKGDLLVDGAVTNNLPVGVMRTVCDGGTVIAVDVSPKVDMRQKSSFGQAISGWKVLTRSMNPFAESMDVPTIANVLMRTTLLGSSSTQAANARNADLCLNPPVASAGLMEFQALDKLAETGYRYALEELQTWWSARAGG
jgi:predicted acylesterase/phospholipase RssA/CRP-like cAMP-binding protein